MQTCAQLCRCMYTHARHARTCTYVPTHAYLRKLQIYIYRPIYCLFLLSAPAIKTQALKECSVLRDNNPGVSIKKLQNLIDIDHKATRKCARVRPSYQEVANRLTWSQVKFASPVALTYFSSTVLYFNLLRSVLPEI